MSFGTVGNNNSFNLVYTPSTASGNSAPIIFSIGDGKEQINADLLAKMIQFAKSGSGSDSSSFSDLVSEAMYKGLSNTEKALLRALREDKDGLANAQVVLKTDNESLDDYSIGMGLPTQKYLDDLKLQEELDFKNRELVKFRRKMERISGIQPMDELYLDVAGTSMRLSNMHVSDIARLNDFKINSPAFS